MMVLPVLGRVVCGWIRGSVIARRPFGRSWLKGHRGAACARRATQIETPRSMPDALVRPIQFSLPTPPKTKPPSASSSTISRAGQASPLALAHRRALARGFLNHPNRPLAWSCPPHTYYTTPLDRSDRLTSLLPQPISTPHGQAAGAFGIDRHAPASLPSRAAAPATAGPIDL